MEGIIEIILFMGFLYWIWPNLFIEGASRANKMVDVITNRMFDAFNKVAPRERQQNESLATFATLKRFSLVQRNRRVLSKEAELKARDNYLYDIKENAPPVCLPKTRPLAGLTCYNCTPVSRESLVNQTTKHLGVKNILQEYPAIKSNGVLIRTFAHLSQTYYIKSFTYKQVAESILQDDQMKCAIEKAVNHQLQDVGSTEEEYYEQAWRNNEKRARKLLNDMRSSMSSMLLKLTSWVLYKLLPCFLSSVVVHSGQVQMLKEASKSGLPLIFLPLHRSHLDYVIVSFILLNNEIRCPLIAAGDNLRIPVFGSLLRGLGAFFIKRRIDPVLGQKDYVYKTLLHSYMNTALRAGHNLEFFLEGGRTRSGKPLMPKYGIFSIVLDAYMKNNIEDALLVPVSINYEKLVDGNFVREQLGQRKQMETFGSAIKAIWHVLNSNYGMARIDFNQPFSIRELVKTLNDGKIQNCIAPPKMSSNPSATSLYGMDVVSEEHKHLVEKISKHVIYDCACSTSIMSTNAVAFLLMYKFRDGATLKQITAAVDELKDDLHYRRRDLGFTGDSLDVVNYAVNLLGPGLVHKEKINNEDVLKPVVELPNVIELNYYSNTLTTCYVLESVVAVALQSLDTHLGSVVEVELVEACLAICDILQYEFIFCKPCQVLEYVITNCIEDLTVHKDVFVHENVNFIEMERNRRLARELFDESDDYADSGLKRLRINETDQPQAYMSFIGRLLMPLIESYSVTAFCLSKLVGRPLLESDFVREVLEEMKIQLSVGTLTYSEGVSSDSIKNVCKLFLKWNVLECHNENSLKLFYLREPYENEQSMQVLCSRIDKYRYGFSGQQQAAEEE